MSDIPPLRAAVPAKARAAKTGDRDLIAAADSDLTAARINAAIDKALVASLAPLRTDHAAQLAARLESAALAPLQAAARLNGAGS